MNIYQRLNEVRKQVSYLQKKKEVRGQGYNAVTHDEVTAYLRQPFIDSGIITVPFQTKSTFENVGETKNGAVIIRYQAWYEISFINMDEPEQAVTVSVESHAMDHGDKAPGKAMSYAVKYAMLKILNIETGEDEESRIEVQRKIEASKPKLNPKSDKWQGAVENLTSGAVTIERIKKHYRLEPEDEQALMEATQ